MSAPGARSSGCSGASRSSTSPRSRPGSISGALTLGFARRFATYKRVYLLTHDPDRMRSILSGTLTVQLLVSGKAHPNDEDGKEVMQRLYRFKRVQPEIADRVVIVEDYDLDVAAHLVSGCDVWVNLPRRPMEASGTSGMKATFNGALQLSVLDGWWDEAYDGETAGRSPARRTVMPPTPATRSASTTCSSTRWSRCSTTATTTGVPQRWCERIKQALVHLRARLQRHAHARRVRRAHLSGVLERASPG